MLEVRARKVATGKTHACAIRGDGSLWCWGSNFAGELGDGTYVAKNRPSRVGNGSDWEEVSVGDRSSVGLRKDGTVWRWGFGETFADGGTERRNTPLQVGSQNGWAHVASGGGGSCATRTDGTLWCWGGNFEEVFEAPFLYRVAPVQVGTDSQWADVAGGLSANMFALRQDGTLWYWGYNNGRFLPQSPDAGFNVKSPTQVGTDTEWVNASLGTVHACGTRRDGSLWCWGDNDLGQLGDDTLPGKPAPARVGSELNWNGVTTGGHELGTRGGGHTCATRTDGTLWCWGRNFFGELGLETARDYQSTPTRVGTESIWKQVFAGDGFSCALLADGRVRCWGYNHNGQLGIGTVADKTTPTSVGGNTSWSNITIGRTYSCGVRSDGSLWCWGEGQYVGEPNSVSRSLPTRIGADSNWGQVRSFGWHTCAIRSDGTLWCWGVNEGGQLGDGTKTDMETPMRIGTESNWASISPGLTHTCGLKKNGTLWCWGASGVTYGHQGQTGASSATVTPRQVGTESNWSQVGSGWAHSCGVRSDGSAWCWGNNQSGRLGLGAAAKIYVYEVSRVGTDSSWTAVTAGYDHTCGRRKDGSVWCWGDNRDGELGDGTKDAKNVPARVGSDSNWATVSAGYDYSCGTRTDGSLWCWGHNYYGQLGDGSEAGFANSGVSSPKRVGNDADWASVTTGQTHTCAARKNGSLWCWGSNRQGQLGDGTAWSSTPQDVVFP